MELSLRANAKINLNLRVLGLREDGFHEAVLMFDSKDYFTFFKEKVLLG